MSRKPNTIELKVVDPENEFNKVQRLFKKLAPQCSVAKRALGIPQLAPQEKQLAILNGELGETKLCITMATHGQHALRDLHVRRHMRVTLVETEEPMATHGQHALRDLHVRRHMRATLVETEELASVLRDQRAQLSEVDCLNYLTQKKLLSLNKVVTSEADELNKIEGALNRLKQIENRLELATKRFCVVNYDNSQIRLEIHRLLVERENFNVQWTSTINKLVKGKMYLQDIIEVAGIAFANRDECCLKMDALKWKGLYGLNRDISEMQQFECELNHLSKLELFLRVKGSRRLCESDEKEVKERQEEMERCKEQITRLDELLNAIFEYCGLDMLPTIISKFKEREILSYFTFQLLCKILQDALNDQRQVAKIRDSIKVQRVVNAARVIQQNDHLVQLREELQAARVQTQRSGEALAATEQNIATFMKGTLELSRLVKCDISGLLSNLGKNGEITNWNYMRHLYILECEVKMLIQIAYGELTPPSPAKGTRKNLPSAKLVDDPRVEILRPNRIDQLVDYVPCSYCVEDYMMNLVFEAPAVVATQEYVDQIFHLEEINTKFGIYTLTAPSKRHPSRGAK